MNMNIQFISISFYVQELIMKLKKVYLTACTNENLYLIFPPTTIFYGFIYTNFTHNIAISYAVEEVKYSSNPIGFLHIVEYSPLLKAHRVIS